MKKNFFLLIVGFFFLGCGKDTAEKNLLESPVALPENAAEPGLVKNDAPPPTAPPFIEISWNELDEADNRVFRLKEVLNRIQALHSAQPADEERQKKITDLFTQHRELYLFLENLELTGSTEDPVSQITAEDKAILDKLPILEKEAKELLEILKKLPRIFEESSDE